MVSSHVENVREGIYLPAKSHGKNQLCNDDRCSLISYDRQAIVAEILEVHYPLVNESRRHGNYPLEISEERRVIQSWTPLQKECNGKIVYSHSILKLSETEIEHSCAGDAYWALTS